jgi:site-specific recombinase XerD
VRHFFRWACASPLIAISENPVADGMIPKTKRRPYEKLMDVDQIVSVLGGRRLENARRSPMWLRNNAMAVLFLETAIRTSELTALTLADLDFENALLTVRHGKGDKYRVVMFPQLAQDAVLDYLASGLRPSDLPDTAPLFGSCSPSRPDWHPMARTQASDLIQRHIKSITGRDDVRPHALRHAAASAMLMQEAPTEDIQQILGHSCIQTTQRYIGLLRPEAAAKRMTGIFSGLEAQARAQ